MDILKKFRLVTLVVMGVMVISCTTDKKPEVNNPQKQETAVEQSPDSTVTDKDQGKEAIVKKSLTFADVAGTYDSYDDEGNSESRFVLNDDGTASWVMIGSLNFSNYTYTIDGNTICLTLNDFETEQECYDYDSEKQTLSNEQGALYLRQKENE